MKKKTVGIILLVITVIVIYLGSLYYISARQSDYDVVITTEQDQYEFLKDGEESFIVPVQIYNKANRILSTVQNNMYLSYHLYDVQGNLISYDNIRTEMKPGVFSGDKQNYDLQIAAMEQGSYRIEIDIVQEGVEWLSEKQNITHEITITVK